jgi:hypothetical protein
MLFIVMSHFVRLNLFLCDSITHNIYCEQFITAHYKCFGTTVPSCGPGGSVSIAIDYGLDSPRIESRWGARFSAPVQTGLGAPPSLLYDGYRVFPGGKVRPGRAADHSPPSSAEIMEK